MQQRLNLPLSKLIAVLAFAAPFSIAHAHGNVSWSVSVGSPAPVYVAPPPVVYVQPQPVYVQPQPVYVRPQPVYVQPSTVIEYRQPYYVEEMRYRTWGYGHGRHHHHHYRD